MTNTLPADHESAAPFEHSPMPIARIRTTVVNLPLVAPYYWASGRYAGTTKTIVEVETKDGITGLGEATDWRYAQLIDDEIAPRLLGVDAWDLQAASRRALPPVATASNIMDPAVLRAFGGVEIALWDIRAKSVGVSLYTLLGGAARTEIKFTEYFSARERQDDRGGESTPAEISDYCARMIEEYDSPAFEGKLGFSDVDTDIAIVREVRAAIGPARTLRVDANMGWSLPTARRALQRLEEFDVSNVEDPVSGSDEMARLRLHSDIPFSTHHFDLRRAVALGVPDAFVLNVTVLGGIGPTLRAIAACEAMGVDFWFYSGDAGVMTATYLHLAAADSHVREPSQSLLRWYLDDVIEGGPFVPRGGVVPVPSGVGLGVSLDRSAVDRLHRHFVEHGPYGIFETDPANGFYHRLPRY